MDGDLRVTWFLLAASAAWVALRLWADGRPGCHGEPTALYETPCATCRHLHSCVRRMRRRLWL